MSMRGHINTQSNYLNQKFAIIQWRICKRNKGIAFFMKPHCDIDHDCEVLSRMHLSWRCIRPENGGLVSNTIFRLLRISRRYAHHNAQVYSHWIECGYSRSKFFCMIRQYLGSSTACIVQLDGEVLTCWGIKYVNISLMFLLGLII